MARRFRDDPHWRGWTWGSVLAAITINVLIALFGVANAHRFGYAGVLERLDIPMSEEEAGGLASVVRLILDSDPRFAHSNRRWDLAMRMGRAEGDRRKPVERSLEVRGPRRCPGRGALPGLLARDHVGKERT